LTKDPERQLRLLFDDKMHKVVRHVSVARSNPQRNVAADISRSVPDQSDSILSIA
jgi:hypothetical protein